MTQSMYLIYAAVFIITLVLFLGGCWLVMRSKAKDAESKKIKSRLENFSALQETRVKVVKSNAFGKPQKKEIQKSLSLGERIKEIMKNGGITNVSEKRFIVCCIIGGSIMAVAVTWLDLLDVLKSAIIGFCCGAYVTYSVFVSMSAVRKKKFLNQFPEVLDAMTRYVQVGLTIERMIKLISAETRDPISSIYRDISQRMEVGINPKRVLFEAADSVDIDEFRFLVIALVLQMETGGSLTETLQNISDIVKKRTELELKIQALSAEAKVSAIIISALPFVFALIVGTMQPDHLSGFLTPGGIVLLKIAFCLLCAGTFAMIKISKITV
ncbi:MAG: type II secretion system F family protein [Holosporaceae bacterium]|jgi:tight adherence protein B|nr:type II secretion system F family protein [Holosporaceae bacterium]